MSTVISLIARRYRRHTGIGIGIIDGTGTMTVGGAIGPIHVLREGGEWFRGPIFPFAFSLFLSGHVLELNTFLLFVL